MLASLAFAFSGVSCSACQLQLNQFRYLLRYYNAKVCRTSSTITCTLLDPVCFSVLGFIPGAMMWLSPAPSTEPPLLLTIATYDIVFPLSEHQRGSIQLPCVNRNLFALPWAHRASLPYHSQFRFTLRTPIKSPIVHDNSSCSVTYAFRTAASLFSPFFRLRSE